MRNKTKTAKQWETAKQSNRPNDIYVYTQYTYTRFLLNGIYNIIYCMKHTNNVYNVQMAINQIYRESTSKQSIYHIEYNK